MNSCPTYPPQKFSKPPINPLRNYRNGVNNSYAFSQMFQPEPFLSSKNNQEMLYERDREVVTIRRKPSNISLKSNLNLH
jgi:hypothetical protein